jgi:hypothetical protein
MDIDQANKTQTAADQAMGAMSWLDKLDPSDWVNLVGVVLATFLGAWLAYLVAGRQESKRDERLHAALKGALLAEVETCVARANTYLNEHYVAPAYRLPVEVHVSTFPQLIAIGRLTKDEARAVIEWHQQVQQINWLLDEIHEHVKATGIGDGSKAQREAGRLIAKLKEMNEPGTRFYGPVMRALGGTVDAFPALDERARLRD